MIWRLLGYATVLTVTIWIATTLGQLALTVRPY